MKKILRLEIPASRVKEPFIYRMVTQHNLVPNILEADLEKGKNGILKLEVGGKPADIESGILFLREADIEVEELSTNRS